MCEIGSKSKSVYQVPGPDISNLLAEFEIFGFIKTIQSSNCDREVFIFGFSYIYHTTKEIKRERFNMASYLASIYGM